MDWQRVDSRFFFVAVCPILQIVAALEKSTARLFVFTADYKLLVQTDLQILPSLLVGFWWHECSLNILLNDGQYYSLELRSGTLFGKFVTARRIGTSPIQDFSFNRFLNQFAILAQSMLLSLDGQIRYIVPKNVKICSFVLLSDSCVVAGLESGALLKLSTVDEPLELFATSLAGEVVSALSLSFSQQFLAAYTSGGSILVFSVADFIPNCSIKPIECTALDMGVPRSVAWVGDDCLALVFSAKHGGDSLFLGGLGGDWAPYEYDSEVFLSSNSLSATILTNAKFQFISRVQPATLNFFGQATSPVKKLVFGYECFLQNNVQSESTIRSIRSELSLAVTQCMEAAIFETPLCTDEKKISLLLKASIFGRQFLKPQSLAVAASRSFVALGGLLRVCLEMNKQGVPVSVSQLSFGDKGALLVKYAAATGQYLLAHRMARWLGLEQSSVAWAIDLVHTGAHLTDSDLCEMIQDKKGEKNLVEIAEFAFRNGRKKLASLLLQSDKVRAAEQVQLLLSLGEDVAALEKAVSFEDVDLIHQCLDIVISKKIPLADALGKIENSALILSLVANRHNSENKFEDLCKLLQTLPNSERQLAEASLNLALSKAPGSVSASWLQYSAQRFASVSEQHQLVGNLLAESGQLVTAQLELEKKLKKNFLGLSLDATLQKLVLEGESVEADALRSRRKMTDGRFWDLHVQTLLDADRFGEAISFVNKVPPPSYDCKGYKTVVRSLVAAKRDDLALPFIRKLKKPKQQAEFLTQLGLHEEARLAQDQRGLFGRFAGAWSR